MPIFDITSPEGKTFRVEGPEGSTRDQALAQVQAQVMQQQRNRQAPRQQPALTIAQQGERNVENERSKLTARTSFPLLYKANQSINATKAAMGRSLLDVPARIRAAGRYYVEDEGKSYGDTLALVRAEDDARLRGRPISNVVGSIAGLFGGGVGGIGKGGIVAGEALLASKIGLGLKQGQGVRNVLRTLAAGGLSGAAHTAATSNNPIDGLMEGGAVGAVTSLIPGALKGTGNLIQKAIPRFAGEAKNLANAIKTSPEELQATYNAMASKVRNPALASALNANQREVVKSRFVQSRPETAEIVKQEARKSLDDLGSRMDTYIGRATRSTRSGKTGTQTLGGAKQAQDAAFKETIAPIQNKRIEIDSLDSTLDMPEAQAVQEIVSRTKSLSNKLGKDSLFSPTESMTVSELDTLRRSLNAASKASVNSNYANSLTYKNAANAIEDHISKNFKQYGKAIDDYAGSARRIEGFKNAASGKRVSDIENNASRANLASSEGLQGQRQGTRARLNTKALESPTSALSLAKELGENASETRLISKAKVSVPGLVTEQFGNTATKRLATSSRIEYDNARKIISDAGVNPKSLGDKSMADPEFLIRATTAIVAGSAYFKANIASQLLSKATMKKETAENLTKMLYDPKNAQKAINILKERAGIDKKQLAGMLRKSIATSAVSSTKINEIGSEE